MAKSPRQSTIDALNKYSQRLLDQNSPKKSTRVHGKPEKEVEAACVNLMRSWGWSVQIFEAKATFDPKTNRYVSQSMKAGTCDCIGSTDDGFAVAIEFKAAGKLSTFNSDRRYLQRKFIVDKINANNFACVVDSAERLKLIYEKWRALRTDCAGKARDYLISMLPVKSEKSGLEDEKLFDDE